MNSISSITKKTIMAITGGILLFFILGHLVGNLGIYIGRESYNSYAELLQASTGFLYIVRVFMLICFVLHITLSVNLWNENKKAKIISYEKQHFIKSTLSSRYMHLSGLIILMFVLFHIMHFTVGLIYPKYYSLIDMLGQHDVYSMVIFSFQSIEISFIYILAQVVLYFHLNHGLQSAVQTLGFGNMKYSEYIKKGLKSFSFILCVCYISIPISVLCGILKI